MSDGRSDRLFNNNNDAFSLASGAGGDVGGCGCDNIAVVLSAAGKLTPDTPSPPRRV